MKRSLRGAVGNVIGLRFLKEGHEEERNKMVEDKW